MTARTLVTLAAIPAAVMLALSATRAARAHARARDAHEVFERSRRDADEVIALRATPPTLTVGKRPEPGIYGQFADALVEVGEPVSTISSLVPGTDTAVAVDGLGACKRQSVRVTLDGLTLPRLGRVLHAWRRAQPDWRTTQVQLTPLPDGVPEPGAALPLRVTMVIEALYLDQPGAGAP